MCFFVITPIQIAKKDIFCYKTGKVYDKTFKSTFFDYVYEVNKKNPFIELKTETGKTYPELDREIIEEGYHSAIFSFDFEPANFLKKAEKANFYGIFVIPKGSFYFENKVHGEYVSSDIIYKGKLTVFLINQIFASKQDQCKIGK